MAPILFPTAMRLGIDPVHFGILIDVNMEVGLCHPPVGLNLTSPPAYRAWHHGADQGRDAVAAHHAGVPRDRDLLPWLTLVVPRAMGML